MAQHSELAGEIAQRRHAWVDTAKGVCIILVVFMHVVVGFEVALGQASWIDPFLEWARLFRMPAFFLVSGLLAPKLMALPWRRFLDRKVAPFAYFYVLWLAIHCLLKFSTWDEGGLVALLEGFGWGLVQPFGLLWFIYLLPVFFVATKAFRRFPTMLWLCAALLAMLPIETGWNLIDQFADRYVYFASGALLAPRLFAFAEWATRWRRIAILVWLAWAGGSAALIGTHALDTIIDSGGAELALSFTGAGGVVLGSALVAGRSRWLAFCGRRSLTIYLAFFIPMAFTRVALIRTGANFDIGLVSLILTPLCVAVPLLMQRLVQGTTLGFLFEQPRRAVAPDPAASSTA